VAIDPYWLTLLLDIPSQGYQAGCVFWQAATGYRMSSPHGKHEQCATLAPPTGDAHLKIQRIEQGNFRVHLNLHVGDLDAAVSQAIAVGAGLIARQGYAVLRSPAGFTFCFVSGHGERTPTTPTTWGSHLSLPDQLAIDVEFDSWDREKTFWADLTGWPVTQSSRPEFARLVSPPSLPVRVLLHRLGTGSTSGHIDIASSDRGAEVRRLSGLGAVAMSSGPTWTVMTGPDGSTFCVTDRDPHTGLLP